MEVKFKIATIDDVEDIILLCNECFDENTDVEKAKEVFKKTSSDENNVYLVGMVDEKIVAHVKITIIPTMYQQMNTYSILNHVCVKKEYRRHNIATKMLKECERICKEKGCSAIKLWSNNFRQAAHGCYKQNNYIVNDATFFSKEI